MTTTLYTTDSYVKEFEATVISANNTEIVLNQTAFFPAGGGLPCDKGTFIVNNKTYTVLTTARKDNNIVHEVDIPGIREGDIVKASLDWQRRYQLMRMHTACHVLSAVFVKEAGALITGNQLDLTQSRVDFNLENFDRHKINDYIAIANTLLKTNQEVTVSFMPRAEAEKIPELAKLAIGLKQGIEEIRVVAISTIDRQADGGPHVKNTSEVGTIQLIKCENKGKANRRVYFTLQ
jgi:Ser-tRNA(Ala) deacylase AlaX